MTDPVPALLVLGPTAGALFALAVLYAGRGGTAPAPIRLTAPTCAVLDLPDLPDWATWRATHTRPGQGKQATHRAATRRNPLASTWPDPPPATHIRQTTALTSSVARAWDQQGYDW